MGNKEYWPLVIIVLLLVLAAIGHSRIEYVYWNMDKTQKELLKATEDNQVTI
jgi:hypothetical protein